MLLTTQLERVFLFHDNDQIIRLSDPDIRLSPQAVQNFYANTYPLLNTASIEGPEIAEDEVRYNFKSTIGTKG